MAIHDVASHCYAYNVIPKFVQLESLAAVLILTEYCEADMSTCGLKIREAALCQHMMQKFGVVCYVMLCLFLYFLVIFTAQIFCVQIEVNKR